MNFVLFLGFADTVAGRTRCPARCVSFGVRVNNQLCILLCVVFMSYVMYWEN